MIKLYVAILSRTWWHKAIGGILIPKISSTEGVYVGIENPTLTWDIPITSNRNGICDRFLKANYDFLLMIDHDKVPLGNPAELVFANEDIIGCPYLTRLKNGKLVWAAYKYIQERDSYLPIDIEMYEDKDLADVDAIGGGCMLIKRCVLEQMPVPFEFVYDEKGKTKRTEDLEFCRKAKEKGFNIYTTPKRRCENFKLTGITGLRDSVKDNAKSKTNAW